MCFEDAVSIQYKIYDGHLEVTLFYRILQFHYMHSNLNDLDLNLKPNVTSKGNFLSTFVCLYPGGFIGVGWCMENKPHLVQ